MKTIRGNVATYWSVHSSIWNRKDLQIHYSCFLKKKKKVGQGEEKKTPYSKASHSSFQTQEELTRLLIWLYKQSFHHNLKQLMRQFWVACTVNTGKKVRSLITKILIPKTFFLLTKLSICFSFFFLFYKYKIKENLDNSFKNSLSLCSDFGLLRVQNVVLHRSQMDWNVVIGKGSPQA